MTGDDIDLDAGEYVLGTLDESRRQQFVEALARDPELQALVDGWEQRLGSLDPNVAPVQPPSDLWDKVDAALDRSPAGSITLRAGAGEWETLGDGVEKKRLYRDPDAGTESYLLRFAPGARRPAHNHAMIEECVVMEGDLWIGDLRVMTGDYHVALPGSDHPEVWSDGGALVYIRGAPRKHAA